MGNDYELSYTPLGEETQTTQNTTDVSQTRKAPGVKMNTLFLPNEIQTSCGCINGLISFSNQLFRFGYLFTFSVLVILTLVIAPLFGFISAILDWVTMLARTIVRPLGRIVADAVGLGSIISLKSEQIQRDLDV